LVLKLVGDVALELVELALELVELALELLGAWL
jgi:hypothetical protein